MIGQPAHGAVFDVKLQALGVHLGKGVGVFEDGGNDGICFIVRYVVRGDDDRLDGDGYRILVDAFVGAGRDDALGINAGDLLQLGNVLVVQVDEIGAFGGAKVGYGGGRERRPTTNAASILPSLSDSAESPKLRYCGLMSSRVIS